MFRQLCAICINDTTYGILSELTKFGRRYDKNIPAYYFSGKDVN